MLRFKSASASGVLPRIAKGEARDVVAICLLSFGILTAPVSPVVAASPELTRAIREAASGAPVLESFSPGEPKYHIFRLNAAVTKHQGNRYSLIRLKVPPGPRRPLVWMFSDIGTIQEYELVRLLDGKPIRGNLRTIYPRLHDPDLEEDESQLKRRLQLPRPWDFFELHILGVPEALLHPGEDYLLWFRFGDDRPADVLVSSVSLESGTKLSEAALPGIVGLPELPAK